MADANSTEMIFIGGSPRSGTSLVQKILGLHSAVFAGPEFDHLPRICKLRQDMAGGITNERQVAFYDKDRLDQAIRSLLETALVDAAVRNGKRVISEKTPDNVVVFDQLADIFPASRFLFVVRDPRATYASFLRVTERDQAGQHTKRRKNQSRSDWAMRWMQKNISAGERFLKRFPDRCRCVFYEDVVTRPEESIRELCRFLGLEFETSMLETDRQNESSRLIAERGGVWYTSEMYDRKIDSGSMDRWKEQLSRSESLYCAHRFAKASDLLKERYGLSEVGGLNRVRLLPFLVRHHGVRETGRMVRKKLGL